MRPRGALLVALLAGCSFDTGGLPVDDAGAPPADAPDTPVPDAMPVPDADMRTCIDWSATNIDPCSPQLQTPAALSLTSGTFTYDTSSGVLTPPAPGRTIPSSLVPQPGAGLTLRVANLTSLSLTSAVTINVVGANPLLIVVHGDATVDGTINASSVAAETPVAGPGASDPACGNGVGAEGPDAEAGAGGGGGGFGDDGGDGSVGDGGGAAGQRGRKASDLDLSPLRGGCRGGVGGDFTGAPGDSGAPPGHGGGAVEITVRGTLTLGGQIAANGSGGRGGGVPRGGGGGGGSGGAILIEAGTVTLTGTATLCANGGGGGEGGEPNLITRGVSGQNGACVATAALGGGRPGNAGGDGGDGGDGGVRGADKGTTGEKAGDASGGGGGGGSAGRIRIRGINGPPSTDAAQLITPAPRID